MTAFFVIDSETNSVNWPADDNAEMGERFETGPAAVKRAYELAKDSPGTVYFVCQAISQVVCPIGEPKLTSVEE